MRRQSLPFGGYTPQSLWLACPLQLTQKTKSREATTKNQSHFGGYHKGLWNNAYWVVIEPAPHPLEASMRCQQ